MADLDLTALRAKAEAADAVAPTGWEADRERMTDTPYKHHEFFAIDGAGNRMFGTENADAAFGLIEVEDDGDGFVAAWNENSRRVIEFAVAAQPRVVLALLDRVEEADAVSEQFNGVVADRNDEIARLRALLARAGEALAPFHLLAPGEARDWADEDGWTDRAPKNERICDWFGPTGFRTARTIAREIEEEMK